MEQNEIYHHGIRGQKWGIRRYQNKDGTLTPAGRKRADKLKDKYTKLTGKQLRRKPTKKIDDQNETRKSKSIKDLSNEELQNKINRLQMEQRAQQLQSDVAGKGKKFVKTVGKDIINASLVNAGKTVLTDWLTKYGKEKLGLNPQETKDSLAELRKEVDRLELNKRKAVAEDYFTKREEKNKKKN